MGNVAARRMNFAVVRPKVLYLLMKSIFRSFVYIFKSSVYTFKSFVFTLCAVTLDFRFDQSGFWVRRKLILCQERCGPVPVVIALKRCAVDAGCALSRPDNAGEARGTVSGGMECGACRYFDTIKMMLKIGNACHYVRLSCRSFPEFECRALLHARHCRHSSPHLVLPGC